MPLTSGSANRVLCRSNPWISTASSSAVRTGSVEMRQCSTTSAPSKTPSTVLVLPTSMVSSILLPVSCERCLAGLNKVEADVQCGRRVGKRSHRKVVHTRLGNGSGIGEYKSAAGFEQCTTARQSNRRPQARHVEVIKQDQVSSRCQRFGDLIERVALDLERHARGHRADRRERRPYRPGRGHVVVLDERGIRQ